MVISRTSNKIANAPLVYNNLPSYNTLTMLKLSYSYDAVRNPNTYSNVRLPLGNTLYLLVSILNVVGAVALTGPKYYFIYPSCLVSSVDSNGDILVYSGYIYTSPMLSHA